MLFWPKYSEVAACSLGLPTGKSVSTLPQFPHHSVCQISIKELLSGGNPVGPLSYSEVARGLSEILTWKRGLSGPKQLEKRSWYENPTNGFFTGKTIWGFLSLKWRAQWGMDISGRSRRRVWGTLSHFNVIYKRLRCHNRATWTGCYFVLGGKICLDLFF